jgi:hypothetical protein
MSITAAPRRHSGSSAFEIDVFDLAAALLLATLVVLVLVTFKQYAVSNDEGVQHHYGELIIAYYKSGFADKSVFNFDNLYLCGGLFDIIAVLLAHLLPFDPYDIRHVMSAVAGIGGVAATWATARMIAGPRAGFLAGLALALCGVWYGGMFNHTKDIPFAAAMMGATYFLLRGARDLPNPRRRDILLFGILLGTALGLRATGLLMVGYALLLIALTAWMKPRADWSESARLCTRSLMRFVPAFAVAYVIMIVSWPWASLDFLNPARAIFAFAHFHYPVRTVLAGQVYLMSDVPRWYEPEYLAIKMPLVVLIGAAAAVMSAAWQGVGSRGKARDDTRLFNIAPSMPRRWCNCTLTNTSTTIPWSAACKAPRGDMKPTIGSTSCRLRSRISRAIWIRPTVTIRCGRSTSRWASVASACRSRTRPIAGCNGLPIGVTPISSSRPRI